MLIIQIMILQKYNSAKQFKNRVCIHYHKFCIFFGDTIAFGANQHPSLKSPSISNDDSEGENDFDQEEHSYQTKKKANVGSDSKKGKARENIQVAFANALTIMGREKVPKEKLIFWRR